jgi:hypothetical protein
MATGVMGMTEKAKPLPRHVVTIKYNPFPDGWQLHCNLCGKFPRVYQTWERANNRRSTHIRGQDAGVDD